MTSNSLVPKSLFGYDVVSVVGEGAASRIYAVTDSKGQLFALKHVVKSSDRDERFLQQLQNEYDVSQKFHHANLRRVIELKTPRRFLSTKFNEAALVMEWVNGQPMDERSPVGMNAVLTAYLQAGAALASLHRLKLVHCDFKPHNVLLDDDGQVKLIDFGQTCKLGLIKQRVQGTPDYITPEQVKCQGVDHKTDIYSFGASVYWSLTGKKVPTYLTIDAANRDVIKQQTFPTPHDLNPEVPMAISAVVMRCLKYNSDQRPDDIVDVLRAIEDVVKANADLGSKPKTRVVKDWGI